MASRLLQAKTAYNTTEKKRNGTKPNSEVDNELAFFNDGNVVVQNGNKKQIGDEYTVSNIDGKSQIGGQCE